MSRLALLNQRAQVGDAAAVTEIGRLLDAHPKTWQEQGDLGRQLRAGWLRLAAENDPVRAEYVRRQVEQMERGWTDPSAGPAGRLLAARAATCYLALQVADAEASAAVNRKDPTGLRDAMTRQAAADRLFMASIKSLAAHQALTRSPPSPADPLPAVDAQAPAGASTR